MSKIHEFKKSLSRGKRAESEFYELFKDKVEHLDGYAADFRIIKNDKLIELKCDSYDEHKTSNFFMERYSYADEPGGPHQSLKKGVDYFIYWFKSSMNFYCFETASLVRELDKLCKDQYLINIYNSNHTTRGYKVPRASLEHIRINIQDILNIK